MTKKVSERMIKLIATQLNVEESQVLPDARFVEQLEADSLHLILLQIAMEEEFKLELKEEEALSIVSLKTALEFLASKGIKD